MTITLNSSASAGGTGDGIPPLIIEAVGGKFRGALVNIEPTQETEYLSEADRDRGKVARPVWWDNKMPTPLDAELAKARDLDPVMYDRITYLTIKSGAGVIVGSQEEERAPEPGELVKFFAHGPRGRAWRDAVKENGGAALSVGSVHLISFDDEDADSRRKDFTVTVEDGDSDTIARAVAAYRDLTTATPPSSTAPPAPTPADTDDDDPF